jgi:hypothetical protein
MKTTLSLLLLVLPLAAQTTTATVATDINNAQAALVQALADLAAIPPAPACPPPSGTGGTLNWFPLNPPNFATGWTWVNQNTASFSTSTQGFAVLTVPYQATAQFNNLVQSLPAPPYTATITFAMTTPTPGSYVTGLTLQNSAGAVNFFVNLYFATGQLVVTHETAAGVIAGETAVYTNNSAPDAQIRSLRIQDTGTTRTFLYSADGGTAFVPLYSEPSGTFIQPTSFGVVVFNKANAGVTVYSTIYNLGVTVP